MYFNDLSKVKLRGYVEYNKLFYIRLLINKFIDIFVEVYLSNRENVIDEGFLKFKGYLVFK